MKIINFSRIRLVDLSIVKDIHHLYFSLNCSQTMQSEWRLNTWSSESVCGCLERHLAAFQLYCPLNWLICILHVLSSIHLKESKYIWQIGNIFSRLQMFFFLQKMKNQNIFSQIQMFCILCTDSICPPQPPVSCQCNLLLMGKINQYGRRTTVLLITKRSKSVILSWR